MKLIFPKKKFICVTDRSVMLGLNSEFFKQDEILDELKNIEISDVAIFRCNFSFAYFNFINCVVLGLGMELEKTHRTGNMY